MKNSTKFGILLLSILLSLSVGVALAESEKMTMPKNISSVNMSITVPQNVTLNTIVPQNVTVNIIRQNQTQMTVPASMTNVTNPSTGKRDQNETSLQPNEVQSAVPAPKKPPTPSGNGDGGRATGSTTKG